jgi:hypothetical protein
MCCLSHNMLRDELKCFGRRWAGFREFHFIVKLQNLRLPPSKNEKRLDTAVDWALSDADRRVGRLAGEGGLVIVATEF